MAGLMTIDNPFSNKKEREQAKKKADAAAYSQQEQNLSGRMNDYRDPNNRAFGISGSLEERQKAIDALELAKVGYGQDIFQTGQDISGIRDRLKARSEQSDPISEAIRGQKAGAMANAQRNLAASGVKGGAAAGAVANVGRAADADIAASLYGQQRQSIADERSLASNTLSGTVGLMQGGKAEGTQSPEAPKASSWTDSVICTELHRQGIMSDELYAKDSLYGQFLKEHHPSVIIGYKFAAKPVVKCMQKSKLFTKLVAPFAMSWARFIAGEGSVVGAAIFIVGVPMCAILGKILMLGEKYVSIGNN